MKKAVRFDVEAQRKWQELFDRIGAPEWIREMQRHYRETGRFRATDLRRLLGDPSIGVEFRPNSSLSSAVTRLRSATRV